ncbi:MAG: hypothetical protein CYPHOPRED_000676 [Cyphobasidiales sp. Tagirdzhanova-0007]|nr:MAG: hypothetical protein CYPHOPRED_000676 [Cyphobasidiales sp. Tagirdzhanova-0007]
MELEADEAMATFMTSSHIAIRMSLWTTISYWIRLKLFQLVVSVAFTLRRLPVGDLPTYTKRYSVLPSSPARIFIPRTYKAGDALLPLFIDIHGGGFALCDPRVDDSDNAILCHMHGICVVSIGYRKGPSWKWPTAPNDCAALIAAVLEDAELPVDKSKVAVGGYSAGANIALASVQLNSLHERITGVVAYYPVVDLSRTLKTKLSYSKVAPGRKRDMLIRLSPCFGYSYVPPGTYMRDPLLSPIFAKRSNLPKKLCLIGCEYDMLCGEARDMAEQLAEGEMGERRTYADAWEQGGVRWELLPGVEHGFNMVPAGKDPEVLAEKRRRTEKMHQSVADWLFREVYV